MSFINHPPSGVVRDEDRQKPLGAVFPFPPLPLRSRPLKFKSS